MHSANCVNDVSEHCDVCRPSDKAPNLAAEGAPAASMFNEKSQVRQPFYEDLVALDAADVPPNYSPLYLPSRMFPLNARRNAGRLTYCADWRFRPT